MGRWSQLVAAEFVPLLNVDTHSSWIDIGSGTGRLSRVIVDQAEPEVVIGIDSSAVFTEAARHSADDDTVQYVVGDGQSLPIPDSRFDAAVSGLVLNFLRNPERMVEEMIRVVRPGGTVGWYVWDYLDGMEFLRYFWDAAIGLDPAADELDEGARFPLCRPDELRTLAVTAGLGSVLVRPINIPTRFLNFDDYWTPFLGGQGPAPMYVAGLSSEQRLELRERLRSTLPLEDDSGIDLRARAWAVRATVRSSH